MSRLLFSVIVPTYNRAGFLGRVLAAWERQEPADLPFEVVAVDDGSTDHTREVLAGWRPARFSLRRASQDNAGPAEARNRALAMASGEIVLFSGDDIEPAPDLLEEHRRAHQRRADPMAAILGLTRWPPDLELTATMRHVDGPGAQQFSYYYLRDGAEYDFRHFYTSNVSVRRFLLELEPDGFSTAFPAAAWEDAEYSWRLCRHGMRIFYHSAAVAFHHHPYEVRSFCRRQQRSGAMARILEDLRPELRKWTGLDDLEWTRLAVLALAPEHRAAIARVARDLETWEGRAVSVAGVFDHGPPCEPVDRLLLPLFRHAYLSGLADAACEEDLARRLRAALFVELIPRGVYHMREEMDELGLPMPAADTAALLDLGGMA